MTARIRKTRWLVALLAGFLLWAAPAMAATNITAVEGAPFNGALYSVEHAVFKRRGDLGNRDLGRRHHLGGHRGC